MLISYIFFSRVFGYHPFVNSKDQPVSEAAEKIMGPDFKTLRDSGIDASQALRSRAFERLHITSGDGLRLSAAYFRASPDCKRTVLLVHGHNSHGMKDNSLKSVWYLDHGFNVLLPDNRACGESEGKWETFGAKESLDTRSWIDELVSMDGEVEMFLDGCSLGGAVVCLLSGMELPDNVRFLVSDCAFTSAKEEFRYYLKNKTPLPVFPFLYTLDLWDRLVNHVGYRDQMPIEAVRRAKKPMIFIHGAEDRYIPAQNARELYDACPTDKQLVFIENAGHAAACVKGGDSYFAPVMRFVSKYM